MVMGANATFEGVYTTLCGNNEVTYLKTLATTDYNNVACNCEGYDWDRYTGERIAGGKTWQDICLFQSKTNVNNVKIS